MLCDSIALIEGSNISNLTIVSGTVIDKGNLTANDGELFFQTDGDSGFYGFADAAWSKIVTGIIDGGSF